MPRRHHPQQSSVGRVWCKVSFCQTFLLLNFQLFLHHRKNPVNKYPSENKYPFSFYWNLLLVAMPRKYIPPNISTPVSWKYVHNRWKYAQQRVVCGKHWIEQTPSLQDFSLRPYHTPKVSTAPKISTCSVANPKIRTYLLTGFYGNLHVRARWRGPPFFIISQAKLWDQQDMIVSTLYSWALLPIFMYVLARMHQYEHFRFIGS